MRSVANLLSCLVFNCNSQENWVFWKVKRVSNIEVRNIELLEDLLKNINIKVCLFFQMSDSEVP